MTISIICPTLNEKEYIDDVIRSFLSQKTSFDLEIILVDGMSTDGTREIIEAYCKENSKVRIVDNPKQKTPFALNIGLEAAKGEYVAILGAHASYPREYVQTCYDELIRTNSVGCTGRIKASLRKKTFESMLVLSVLESPFGVSGSSFRTMKEGYTHSVGYAVFQKKALLDVGGYNQTFFRNQDNDMNQRLLDVGHKLFCTWKTECAYYPPDSIPRLLRYAYNNGYWNAFSLKTNPRSMRLYHFVPFLFLSSLLVSLFAGLLEYLIVGTTYSLLFWEIIESMYFIVAIGATIFSFFKGPHLGKLYLPLLFFGFHIVYGWGTLQGFVDFLWKKKVS